MVKEHLLTISASPGVPEPAEEESEPVLVVVVVDFSSVSLEVELVLVVLGGVEVTGAADATTGDPGGGPPGHDGCLHGNGDETALRVK